VWNFCARLVIKILNGRTVNYCDRSVSCCQCEFTDWHSTCECATILSWLICNLRDFILHVSVVSIVVAIVTLCGPSVWSGFGSVVGCVVASAAWVIVWFSVRWPEINDVCLLLPHYTHYTLVNIVVINGVIYSLVDLHMGHMTKDIYIRE